MQIFRVYEHFILSMTMGALSNNRKRNGEYFSADFHKSKKPKSFHSPIHHKPVISSNSTASRISQYPDTKPQFRRIHAPVRIQKHGPSKLKDSVPKGEGFNRVMGNFLSSNFNYAKIRAFGGLGFSVKEKEVVDVDDEREAKRVEVVLSDDDSGSGVEEVGGVKNSQQDDECNRGVDERNFQLSWESAVTDGNLKVDGTGKLIDSLSLDRELVNESSLEVYKNLLEKVAVRDPKLEKLNFEIQFNEKRRASLQSLRPVKKPTEPVKPRELFIPLTDDEVDEVGRAFRSRRVLVTHQNSGIDITGQVLQCLRPGQWLNDEVINVYLDLLKEREYREPKKFLKCHFFNTFFYNKLRTGEYKAVKRWTTIRKLGYSLIDCDKIFVPIHRQIHWCLAIINAKDKKFQYLDSLKGRDSEVLKSLAAYYVEEVKDKSGKVIDTSSWEMEFVDDLPEQKNGFDCGMFMVKYADFYSRGLGLDFDQGHMPYFRYKTAKEILRLRAD